jgi:PAS domain-containing protein
MAAFLPVRPAHFCAPTGTPPDTRAWPVDEASRVLVAENATLRLAIEQLPHGLCMFDSQDRLTVSNRRYRDIWNLPEAVVRPGTTFAEIMAATRGVEAE